MHLPSFGPKVKKRIVPTASILLMQGAKNGKFGVWSLDVHASENQLR